jgi:tetratricopeptide (TPR) repeat protein
MNGMILYNKRNFSDAQSYLVKAIDYMESLKRKPISEIGIFFPLLYYQFGGIKYVMGFPDEAEKYRRKALKLEKLVVNMDYSELNEFM